MITRWQKEFAQSEFKHPELVKQEAYDLLVQVRRRYGKPLVLTDDGRTPDDRPPGYSKTSLHYLGQAFDLRIYDKSEEELWALAAAVMSLGSVGGIELELVWSNTDKHCHIGFRLGLGGGKNTLLIRGE